jgi:hypothetical protein
MSAATPTVTYTYMYGTRSTLLKLHELQTLQLLVIVKYPPYKTGFRKPHEGNM